VNGLPVDVATDWTRGGPRFVLAVCDECSNTSYLPAEHCSRCGARGRTPRVAVGTGTCVSVTWVHVTVDGRGDPAGLVLVELDEGPVVMGRTAERELRPGDGVGVAFESPGAGGGLVPVFSRKA
jgi:uncharacterized OB-fold protein